MIFIRLKQLRLVLVGSLLLTSVARASGPSGIPPIFTERSPETTIVNLAAGQNSFECTGKAIDLDVGDLVYISTAPLPPFMRLDVMNGNPATFRLHAENLTLANYGGYAVDVIASDSPTSLSSATSISFAIGIIPEPTSAAVLMLALSWTRRRVSDSGGVIT